MRELAPTDLTDFDQRLRAVVAFAALPEARALAAANKRIGNILRQASHTSQPSFSDARFEPGAETELGQALRAAAADCRPAIEARDYVAVLKRLAALREPIDHYFDKVMVMVDDAELRENRLAMLSNLRAMFLRVADISQLPAA